MLSAFCRWLLKSRSNESARLRLPRFLPAPPPPPVLLTCDTYLRYDSKFDSLLSHSLSFQDSFGFQHFCIRNAFPCFLLLCGPLPGAGQQAVGAIHLPQCQRAAAERPETPPRGSSPHKQVRGISAVVATSNPCKLWLFKAESHCKY